MLPNITFDIDAIISEEFSLLAHVNVIKGYLLPNLKTCEEN